MKLFILSGGKGGDAGKKIEYEGIRGSKKTGGKNEKETETNSDRLNGVCDDIHNSGNNAAG